MTRPGEARGGRPPRNRQSGDAGQPVDDFASQVLDVVDSIPPGRVISYGDIAEYLAAGARGPVPQDHLPIALIAVHRGRLSWLPGSA